MHCSWKAQVTCYFLVLHKQDYMFFVEFILTTMEICMQWTSCCERSAKKGIPCDFLVFVLNCWLYNDHIHIYMNLIFIMFVFMLMNRIVTMFTLMCSFFFSQIGYEISDEKFNDIFSRFRELTKQKKVSTFLCYIFSCTHL